MSKKIVTGFIVKDVSLLSDLETVLFEMRNIVTKCASKSYEKLVTMQIERIVDEIALNQYQRPVGECILDIAAAETRRRILYAEQRVQQTEYNLYIGVQVMIGKYDGKPVVYLKTHIPNDIYTKSLKKIPELIPMDIYEEDTFDKTKSSKKELWNSLCTKYEQDIPLVSNLILYDELSINPEDMVFRSPMERASEKANEKVMNHLLASYACDQEIKPHKLMEFVFQSISRMSYSDIKDLVESEQNHLLSILPNITQVMILDDGIIKAESSEGEKKEL